MALLLGSATLANAESFESAGISYETIDGSSCRLVTVTTIPDVLDIPSSVDFGGKKYTVSAIGDDACKNSDNLQSLTIPGTVTTIGVNAFYGNWGLTTISIGEGMQIIGRQAFDSCPAVTLVKCYATVPPKGSGAQMFSPSAQAKATLQVPAASVEAYKNDIMWWGGFANTIAFPEATGTPEAFEFDGMKFTATTDGACILLEVSPVPTKLSIPESVSLDGKEYAVTEIADNACKGSDTLETLEIPNSVTKIGANAFFGNWKLSTVSIGSGVESIGRQAFDGCSAITLVKCYAPVPPKGSGANMFSANAVSKAVLQVPEASVEAYKNDVMWWGDFAKVTYLGDNTGLTPGGDEPEIPSDHQLVLTRLTPADKSARHSLSTFKLSFYLTPDEEDMHMIFPVRGETSGIRLEREGFEPVYASRVSNIDDYPATSVEIVFPTQTADGNYKLIIPAGSIGKFVWDVAQQKEVLLDNMTNAEITAEYTVSAAVPSIFGRYVLTPASGKELASINEISLTFPDTPYALDIDEDIAITLSDGTDTYTGDIGGWGNERRLTFRNKDNRTVTIDKKGTYTLTIPAGVFSAEGESNDAIIATYTITDDINFDYTCTPLNLSDQEIPDGYLVTVTFDFPDASEISTKAFDSEASFVVKYGDQEVQKVGNATTGLGYQLMASVGEATLTVRINDRVFAEPGILTICADKGAFTVDGLASPAIDYALNYGVVRTFEYTVTPEKGTYAKEFSTFTVSFPTATEGYYNEAEAWAVLFKANNSCTEYTVKTVEGASCPTFEFTFDPAPTVLGEYSFTVDSGSFILDKYFHSPIITGKYYLTDESGVENVSAEASSYTVFSIDGRLVMQAAERSALDSLKPGLYIVNGRKLFIK